MKKIDYSKLGGQALSDVTAEMMAPLFHALLGKPNIKGGWHPHTDFNQCRIVEDWIVEKNLFDEYLYHLAVLTRKPPTRTICEDRLRAALMAWQENKGGAK